MKSDRPRHHAAARKIQERLRKLVSIRRLAHAPRFVAGVDAAFFGDHVCAAACVYLVPSMTLVDQATAVRTTRFRYVPGQLFFREGPAVIAALRTLKIQPDLLLVDGQGIAHPLGIGSASHIGIVLGMPTIGCAKTHLVGEYRDPGNQRGAWTELQHQGAVVGAVVRTRTGVRPLFVSPGHRIDIEGAIRIVLQCSGTYRIPEPLRCADILSRKLRAEARGSHLTRPPS